MAQKREDAAGFGNLGGGRIMVAEFGVDGRAQKVANVGVLGFLAWQQEIHGSDEVDARTSDGGESVGGVNVCGSKA